MSRSIVVAVWIAVLGLPLGARNQKPEPSANQPTLRITSRAVLVDVIVTGKDGRPVKGLKQNAFTVTEQGKPQTVSFFEEHTEQAVAPVQRPKLPPNVFSNSSPYPPPAAVNVVLLDSLNTRMSSQSWVRAQALKFLRNGKPGTQTAIFTMGLGLRFIQGFTSDPATLVAALKNKKNNSVEQSVLLKGQEESKAEQDLLGMMSETAPGGGSAASSGAITDLSNFLAENTTSRGFDRYFRTLQNLQRLAAFLNGFPGRKNLIWFAESVPAAFLTSAGAAPGQENPSVDVGVRGAMDMLSAARVAIYPVDARGLEGNALYEAQNMLPKSIQPTGQTFANMLTADDQARNADQASMGILAQQTGGRAFKDTNGLGQVMQTIQEDTSDFYTLSYTPTDENMNGAYRKIDVKVSGGKYDLFYRQGYYALDQAVPGNALKTRDEALHALQQEQGGAVDPLLPFMDLGMPQSEQILYQAKVQPLAEATGGPDKGKLRYGVDFAIDLRDLQLKLDPDGVHLGQLSITLLIYDRYGKIVNHQEHLAALTLKPDVYAVFQKTGVHIHADIATPKGNYWLRTGIYDANSGKVGTLEIPLAAVKPVDTSGSSAEALVAGHSKLCLERAAGSGLECSAPQSRSSQPAPGGSSRHAGTRASEPAASEGVTVEKVEQLVKQLHDRPDKEAAQRLDKCKLTERLSTVRLESLEDSLPGERSRSALLAIADVSAFLPPPRSDLSVVPAPDLAAQRAMLSRAVDFVIATTARMPDFLAQRLTYRFQDARVGIFENDPDILTPDLYHLIDKSVVTVRYRNGHEEIDSASSYRQHGEGEPAIGLTTQGVFGPLLETVMHDILKGKLGWSHWEQSPSGLTAVFRYSVPKEQATFTSTWCCVEAGPGVFREIKSVSKYHGEISVDPQSGAIARIVLMEDAVPGQPVSVANLFVEYAPTEIGGKTYVCPRRSATLLVAKSPVEHGKSVGGVVTLSHAPVESLNVTSISDARFEQYHVFRSEMRIKEH